MRLPRSSGILLHITSLPGPFGIGDLGGPAFDFVGLLQSARQRVWQVLPLGPTAQGNSPYTCYSAFAGNPLLISPSTLVADGLLRESDLQDASQFPRDRVDYEAVGAFKERILQSSFHHFLANPASPHHNAYREFCRKNRWWLDDHALFMALVEAHGRGDWTRWDPDLVQRRPKALQRWAKELCTSIELGKYVQFLFFRQWRRLRDFAAQNGIQILGDLPIFAAYESSDVWVHQELFCLDRTGARTVAAGVPPDCFSETGQLWGNPLYRWDKMAETCYGWWVKRFRHAMSLFDIIRIDHFRGFESHWEVPVGAKTAAEGRWVRGPGAELFHVLENRLGELPIVAEDLGFITPEVHALRDDFDFPGMRVLQFAFDDDTGPYHRPESFPHNCVVYTGTHDNDTTAGWFRSRISNGSRGDDVLDYLGTDGREIHWDFIRLAWSSPADIAIAPLQDVLGLGSEARMNTPGRPDDNWTWRCGSEILPSDIVRRLSEITRSSNRAQGQAATTAP